MAGETDSGLRRVGDTRDILGEVPVWSAAEQALYWVDVRAPCIRRRDDATGAVQSWPMPELAGCIALRAGRRGLIVGLRSSVALFDPATGTLEQFPAPHAGKPQMRFNDGKCDPQGRFWVGSMDDVGRGPVGTLYRFDAGKYTAVLEGIAVPNGLCWSPDGTTMYFVDSLGPVIWSYPFDPASGEPGERRLFARLPEGAGMPDGATVDADGFMWSACYGGSLVTRYAPDGSVERSIAVPVSQPTSCAFGGADLATLFITSASQRLSAEALQRQPLAGALFALRTGTRGCPEPQYAG